MVFIYPNLRLLSNTRVYRSDMVDRQIAIQCKTVTDRFSLRCSASIFFQAILLLHVCRIHNCIVVVAQGHWNII